MSSHSCPACASPLVDLFVARDENRCISSLPFHYGKCAACGLISLLNVPDDLAHYYQDEYYAIPTLAMLDAIAQKDPAKIDTVRSYATTGRLLEIGPAFGVFAHQAKQSGFEVDVIEMDARCCDFLRTTVGVNAIQSQQPEEVVPTLDKHDVIVLWHVFEHLPHPFALLQALAQNLVSGGILIIAMPNPEAFQFRLMGKHWPHLDAPRHLTLIPAQQLIHQAQAYGLTLLSCDTDDSDARSWNRFGWQRLLMNRFSSKTMQRLMFVAGYLLSWLFAPFERRTRQGSAYTAIFRKTAA